MYNLPKEVGSSSNNLKSYQFYVYTHLLYHSIHSVCLALLMY